MNPVILKIRIPYLFGLQITITLNDLIKGLQGQYPTISSLDLQSASVPLQAIAKKYGGN